MAPFLSGHQHDRVPIEMVPWVHIKTHADAPLDIDRKLIIAQGNETPQSLTFVPLRPFSAITSHMSMVC